MITLLDTTVWTGNAAQKRIKCSGLHKYHVVAKAGVLCVPCCEGCKGEQNINNEAPPLLNNLTPSHHDKKMLEC
jgi:hypothetical protein